MRCKHKYNGFTSISFQPPTQHLKRINGTDDETLLRLIYGLSTITQECSHCGKAHSYTVAGDARQQ